MAHSGDDGRTPRTLEVRGPFTVADDASVGDWCIIGGANGPAVIESGCRLGDHAKIGGSVFLGSGSQVGDYVVLGHATKRLTTGHDPTETHGRAQRFLVRDGSTRIGPDAVLRSHSVVYLCVRVGSGLTTGHHVLIREHTTIGDRCIFGSYASCDGYTVVGSDTHVGQYAQLSQGARIGNGCFIGGHTVFSDNRMAVRIPDRDLDGAVVGDFVRIGLGCVILPGVSIGEGAMVGAGSIVSRDVPSGVLAFGSPCRVIRSLQPEELADYRDSFSTP
ncbi:MAG: hypothetical protein M3198_02275 [Actinomycetota bacterium]|nr:hypothetical protein [Actinomycetota bacterium]